MYICQLSFLLTAAKYFLKKSGALLYCFQKITNYLFLFYFSNVCTEWKAYQTMIKGDLEVQILMRATNTTDFNYADKMKCPSNNFLQPHQANKVYCILYDQICGDPSNQSCYQLSNPNKKVANFLTEGSNNYMHPKVR